MTPEQVIVNKRLFEIYLQVKEMAWLIVTWKGKKVSIVFVF